MVYIDFQGGAHGNYLEFVCNKFIAGVEVNTMPFDKDGASHNKVYTTDQKFTAWHYFNFLGERTTPTSGKIISIQITSDDLLPLSSISLLRSSNHNCDNDNLEIDTYHKLSTVHYKWVLDNILSSFFTNQVKESYDAVKDPSWPAVQTYQDFQNLPKWIQDECLTVHNLQLLELSETNPNCPRHVLREFFKIGFKNPQQFQFMHVQQTQMWYYDDNDVYIFPYAAFYDTNLFVNEIKKVAVWCNENVVDLPGLLDLHAQFLRRQPYKDSKLFVDNILARLYNSESFELPKVNLLQESYINAKLEEWSNKEINVTEWFSHSDEIYRILK